MTIEIEIQLRYNPRPQCEARAKFLPGADPVAWLRELAAWDVDHEKLALYVLPQSREDLRPRGLLATTSERTMLGDRGGGYPYGLLAGRLFVPVHASIYPELTDVEWAEHFSDNDRLYVWNAEVGLIGFEAADSLRLSDLLQMPESVDGDWSRADPGTAFHQRLFSIEAEQPPSVEQILESGRDGIGTKGGDVSQLPRPSAESATRQFRALSAAALVPFALIAHWLARLAPNIASQPTWINKLDDWARQSLKSTADLWNSRLSELQRLMRALDSDPDEGLKLAIPMGGDAWRVSSPSGRLVQRIVDFSLARLGGGTPADYWDVPAQVRSELETRYRSLAGREVRLGRHRRAAYIYAQLLNDLNSAAACLANGGHYREAAVLYRDRLNRPLDAAKCLERGGLLHEAILLYLELKRYVEVGDLYSRLEQPQDARAAYREAANERLQQRDYLGAARLLDAKLGEPEEAISALDSGWPASLQARACLEGSFQLMARLGRHEAAAERVRTLRQESMTPTTQRLLVESLAVTSGGYPDAAVRTAAADAVRVVTSRALTAGHKESRAFLRALERLVPEDRLLLRDCRRYERPETLIKPAPPRRGVPGHSPCELVRTIPLPKHFEWRGAAAIAAGFYVVGTQVDEVVLVRGSWNGGEGELDRVSWRSRIRFDTRAVMSVDPSADPAIRLMFPHHTALPRRTFPATAAFPNEQSAETPGWLSDTAWAMDAALGTTWVLTRSPQVLQGYNRDGLPIATRVLPAGVRELLQHAVDSSMPPCIAVHARDRLVYIGMEDHLFCVARDDQVEVHKLDSRIRSIVASGNHSNAAVLCEQGGSVKWPTQRGNDWSALPADLVEPRGVFLRDARLLICTADEWQVYSKQKAQLQLQYSWPSPNSEDFPLEVLRTHAPNEFAVLWAQGEIVVYRLSS